MTNAAQSNQVNEGSPDRAVDSSDRAAVAAFNAYYQKFAGDSIETRKCGRPLVEWSPAFTKVVLAGGSGLVAALVVTHAFVQDMTEPETYTYREPVSAEQNFSSKLSTSATATRSAVSQPEVIETQPQRRAPTQTSSSAEVPQGFQSFPLESLAVIPQLPERTENTAFALHAERASAPANATQPSAPEASEISLPVASELPLGFDLTPASLPDFVQAENAPPEPPTNDNSNAVNRPAATPSPSPTPTPPQSAASDRVFTTQTSVPESSSRSARSANDISGQDLDNLLSSSKQNTTVRVLSLSDRAAIEAAQGDVLEGLRVVRLPLLDYQRVWLDLQTQTKIPFPMPSNGFIDYRQRTIVLPRR